MELVKLPKSPETVSEPDWSAHLSDPADQLQASTLWNAITSEMREAQTLSLTNAPEMKRYVLICVMYDRTFAQIENEGAVIRNKRSKLATYNPNWSILKDCDAIASGHEDRLGLSPRRRGQVTPAKKPKATNTGAADGFLTG